jgi:hypothetical protein
MPQWNGGGSHDGGGGGGGGGGGAWGQPQNPYIDDDDDDDDEDDDDVDAVKSFPSFSDTTPFNPMVNESARIASRRPWGLTSEDVQGRDSPMF